MKRVAATQLSIYQVLLKRSETYMIKSRECKYDNTRARKGDVIFREFPKGVAKETRFRFLLEAADADVCIVA